MDTTAYAVKPRPGGWEPSVTIRTTQAGGGQFPAVVRSAVLAQREGPPQAGKDGLILELVTTAIHTCEPHAAGLHRGTSGARPDGACPPGT